MHQLSIPPLLRGTQIGSFAEHSIVSRLPETALRVISENNFDARTNDRIRILAFDLPYGLIRPLADEEAPDFLDWQKALQPFLGHTWLEVPLFFAEVYFYRRILEATGYFINGPGYTMDPYRRQKELGWLQAASTLAHALPEGLPEKKGRLWKLIHMSLWGNQADLSLWPVQGQSGGRSQGEGGETHLLVDNTEIALKQIEDINGGYVDYIVDNVGTELSYDLLLLDSLLVQNPAINIRLHVRPFPCFVSDTIVSDVEEAIYHLQSDAPFWAYSVAKRLEQAIQTGQLLVVTHFYWASPFPGWDMPEDLWVDIAQSKLIISKGDVNYRRWLGDARWPADAPLATIINPTTSLLLLRVVKSDVIAGLKFNQEKDMLERDPDWQFNGHWGVIQLVQPQKKY